MTDPTAAEQLAAALDHVMADMGTSEAGCDVVLYAHGQHMISVSGLRGILDENKRLEAESEELADFDRMTTEREKWRGERDRAVQLWHERGKEIDRLREAIAAQIEERAATLTPRHRAYRAFHSGLMAAARIARGLPEVPRREEPVRGTEPAGAEQ